MTHPNNVSSKHISSTQIAQFLLTVGADVDAKDNQNRTSLQVAKKEDMIGLLNGAKERLTTGTAALHRLSSTGDAVSLKQFLVEFVGRTDEVTGLHPPPPPPPPHPLSRNNVLNIKT